ncbi:unnamed protein product [Sphagnum tenellum]
MSRRRSEKTDQEWGACRCCSLSCSSSLLCCLPLLTHACEGRNTTDCRARSTSADNLPQTLPFMSYPP